MRAAPLVLAACWTGTPASSTEPTAPSSFAIALERTPCLGTCPVYRVSIDGDGRVTWQGLQHVETTGVRRATVPPQRVRVFERKLAELKFFERDERGELPRAPQCIGGACSFPDETICSDTSAAIIAVRQGTREHTVRNDHCDGSPLDELEALIDDVARTSVWIHTRVAPALADPR